MTRYGARISIIFCLAGVLCAVAAPVRAQSLGDVARKEQDRRKSAPVGKVYTNEHLPAVPPAPAASRAVQDPAGSAASADAAAKPANGAETKTDEKKDEKYWRERLAKTREARTRAESFAEALQSRINALSADFVNRDDPAQRTTVAADRDKALAELDRVRTEIQELTKAVDDIQEEARREGVPAGWVR